MLTGNATQTAPRQRRSFVSGILRLSAAAVFICLFAAPQAFATWTYSDSWIDDTDPNAGQLVSSSLTRTEYYEEWHMVTAVTTITSPDGRSQTIYDFDSGAGYKQPWVARAEAVLPWDFNDLGTYNITSQHYSDCPMTDFGPTSLSTLIGVSITCLTKTGSSGTTHTYTKVPGCSVFCPTDAHITGTDLGAQIIAARPWIKVNEGPRFCSSVNLATFVTPQNCICADYFGVHVGIPGLP